MFWVATIIFLFVCVLMVIIVLVQPHEGGGLAGAFGGGVNDSFFGTKALSYAWKFTIVLVCVYFGLAIALNKIPHPAAKSTLPAGLTSPAPTDSK